MTSPIDCVMGFLAGISVAAGVWAYYMEFVVCAKIERALWEVCEDSWHRERAAFYRRWGGGRGG